MTSFFSKIKNAQFCLSASKLTLFSAISLVLFYNPVLWEFINDKNPASGLKAFVFDVTFFVVLAACLNLLLSLVAFRFIQKPVLALLIIGSAMCSYFMSQYGIVIDNSMMQNLIETDIKEALDLVTFSFTLHLLLFAGLPIWLISRCKISYLYLTKQVTRNLVFSVLSLSLIFIVALPQFKSFSSFLRNHREVRYVVVPSNFIYYGLKHFSGAYDLKDEQLQHIGDDARLSSFAAKQAHRTVAIVVLGETARAHNFSLNGYSRKTNPELEKLKLYNFSDVSSCGTATAVSVPCMFSDIDKDDYTLSKVRNRENVLDVIKKAGISVLWRDNNSGCKGVCDRVETQVTKDFYEKDFCKEGRCFDEALLNNIDKYLAKTQADVIIVLHQLGSHGPSYFKRYPASFNQFKPACESSDLQDCSQQSIFNSYDNTILYTDYFLSKVIKKLEQRKQDNTLMLYVSDHGESLGENNIYLHGLPYFMAPDYQTKVPFIIWLSDNYRNTFKVDDACIQSRTRQAWSHNNLFHTLLGLMSVKTKAYRDKLDIFSGCKQ